MPPANPPAQLESPESSSPIITRAVAAGLRNQYSDSLALPGWQKAALALLGRLPPGAAHFVVSRMQSLTGLNPELLERLNVDALASERLRDYDHNPGPFPALTIGAALGGASAHLALALGGPFLPQAFVTTLRGGAPDGNVQTYFQRSAGLALRLAEHNPGILTIQHYDPVHDGWITRFANHLRFKLLDLPRAYAAFIRSRLQPGGALCYLDCGAEWLRYRVGPRSLFQVGGWGDISPEEYLEGSPRLQRYCAQVGLKACDWRLPGYPLARGPESEWGSEPGLGAALQAFCEQHGYRFVPIRLPEPLNYSRLAFRAVWRLLEKAGRQPPGVLVETFTQFDATAVLRSGLLPLWLIFNTQDSRRFLEQMAAHFPDGPLFFSPLVTFSHTPDMAPWPAWEEALGQVKWTNIGARPSHYPDDALALVRWSEPLRRWVAEHERPLTGRLEAEELAALASELVNE